jgi:hypothetical protein
MNLLSLLFELIVGHSFSASILVPLRIFVFDIKILIGLERLPLESLLDTKIYSVNKLLLFPWVSIGINSIQCIHVEVLSNLHRLIDHLRSPECPWLFVGTLPTVHLLRALHLNLIFDLATRHVQVLWWEWLGLWLNILLRSNILGLLKLLRSLVLLWRQFLILHLLVTLLLHSLPLSWFRFTIERVFISERWIIALDCILLLIESIWQ